MNLYLESLKEILNTYKKYVDEVFDENNNQKIEMLAKRLEKDNKGNTYAHVTFYNNHMYYNINYNEIAKEEFEILKKYFKPIEKIIEEYKKNENDFSTILDTLWIIKLIVIITSISEKEQNEFLNEVIKIGTFFLSFDLAMLLIDFCKDTIKKDLIINEKNKKGIDHLLKMKEEDIQKYREKFLS